MDVPYFLETTLMSFGTIIVHVFLRWINQDLCKEYRADENVRNDNTYFGLGYRVVDDIHQYENDERKEKIWKIWKFLFNRERPFAMDLLRYLGIIFFFIGVSSHTGYPYMIVITVIFFVGYDLFYFVFSIIILMQIQRRDDHRREAQCMVGLTYSVVAGFPFGPVTKILLACWLDGRISFAESLSIFTFLLDAVFIVSLVVFPILLVFICCHGCSKLPTSILVGSAITAVIAGVSLNALYAVVEKVEYLANQNETISHTLFLWKPIPDTLIGTHMLIMWIPAMLTSIVFVNITTRHGIFSLYFPDYISFWLFMLTSYLVVFHVDHLEETANWYHDGIPFYPLLLDVILGVAYYIYKRKHFIEEIDIEEINQDGQEVVLLNIPQGDLFNEISTLVHSTWCDAHLHKGRDAGKQSQKTIHIKHIFNLTTKLSPSNAAISRYKTCRAKLKSKYQGQDILAIDEIYFQNKRTSPVHTDTRRLGLQKLTNRLDSSINETYLFHGTRSRNVKDICLYGFDVDRSGTRAGAAYGDAVYFAEDSSKSDQYTDEKDNQAPRDLHMFIAKVALGKTYVARTREQFSTLPCQSRVQCLTKRRCRIHDMKYDSILMAHDGMLYREYLVFNNEQIFPEFLIVYDKY